MPNGQEAILLGCQHNQERLYKVYWNKGNLEWTIMTQTMKYPRTDWPIAMFIPDEINTCKLGKYVFGKHIKNCSSYFVIYQGRNVFQHLLSYFVSVFTLDLDSKSKYIMN